MNTRGRLAAFVAALWVLTASVGPMDWRAATRHHACCCAAMAERLHVPLAPDECECAACHVKPAPIDAHPFAMVVVTPERDVPMSLAVASTIAPMVHRDEIVRAPMMRPARPPGRPTLMMPMRC